MVRNARMDTWAATCSATAVDGLRDHVVRRAQHDRHADVAARSDGLGHRHGAEERHVQFLGEPSPAAAAEQVGLVAAGRAGEVAHVLDDAKHRDVQLPVHVDGAPRVGHRDGLRRGHDHGAGDGGVLAEAERDVARARRHVHDQVVERRPGHILQELPQHAMQHRPSPDDRIGIARQESHRHGPQPVLLDWHDLLAIGLERAPARRA